MKKRLFSLFCSLTMVLSVWADEIPNGDNNHKSINLSHTNPPTPHAVDVNPPEAMYNIVTQELTVTLDAVHYSDYTITLVSGLIEVDYYPFSPLVCLPTASMGDVVTIYIESDDCGCWYGEIDKAEFGGPISN